MEKHAFAIQTEAGVLLPGACPCSAKLSPPSSGPARLPRVPPARMKGGTEPTGPLPHLPAPPWPEASRMSPSSPLGSRFPPGAAGFCPDTCGTLAPAALLHLGTLPIKTRLAAVAGDFCLYVSWHILIPAAGSPALCRLPQVPSHLITTSLFPNAIPNGQGGSRAAENAFSPHCAACRGKYLPVLST